MFSSSTGLKSSVNLLEIQDLILYYNNIPMLRVGKLRVTDASYKNQVAAGGGTKA